MLCFLSVSGGPSRRSSGSHIPDGGGGGGGENGPDPELGEGRRVPAPRRAVRKMDYLEAVFSFIFGDENPRDRLYYRFLG